MLSDRVQTIIILDPRATAYIIINILVATAMYSRVRVTCTLVLEQRLSCVYVCNAEPQYNGRPRTGVELEERTEREAYLHTEPPYIMWNGYFAIYRVSASETLLYTRLYLLRCVVKRSVLQLSGFCDSNKLKLRKYRL